MANNKAVVANELDLNHLTDDDIIQKEVEEPPASDNKKREENPEPEKAKADKPDNTGEEPAPTLEELENEIKNLSKRYDSSTNEGKRLFKENQQLLKELETFREYKPIFDEIASNKELQRIAREMISGEKNAPVSDDVTFDMDEAIRNPNSQSAKILDNLVEKRASKIVNEQLGKIKSENDKKTKFDEINKEIARVQKEYGLDEDMVDNVINFAKEKGNVGFEDMLYLYNKSKWLENNKSKSKSDDPNPLKILDQIKQLNKTKDIPKNVKGNNSVGLSLEQSVAKMIREAGGMELKDMY